MSSAPTKSESNKKTTPSNPEKLWNCPDKISQFQRTRESRKRTCWTGIRTKPKKPLIMNIPKQAKKVFSGILFDTYQRQQELYDGSSTTFEMIARKPTVDIIATIGEKIILLKQSQPWKPNFLGLPWGRVEEDETALKWAKRELLEETGAQSKTWKKLTTWDSASKIHFEETLFIAQNCDIILLPNPDAGEKIALSLIDFEEFLWLAREKKFTCPYDLKILLFECLIDENLRNEFKNFIFN